MKLFLPWPLFATSFLLFFVVAWFSLATVDFEDSVSLSGFRTGGWFELGFPFLLCCAMIYAAFFTFIARHATRIAAVASLLAVTSSLTYSGVTSKLPGRMLTIIIGSDHGRTVTVKRFRTFDSFNDGMTVYGVLSLNPDAMRDIVRDRHLVESESNLLSFLSPVVDTASIPETGQVLQNNRTRVYYDELTETMYFGDHVGRSR